MKPLVALALDSELRRVAALEAVFLEELVKECASLIGRTPRMFYNYRSGKWAMPADAIPLLCHRFKSRALLEALTDEVNRAPITIPDHHIPFDQLGVQIIKETCDHLFALIQAHKSESLNRDRLDELEAAGEERAQRQRLLFRLLEAEHEQRLVMRRKQA